MKQQQIKIVFAHNENGSIDQDIGQGIKRYVRNSKGRIQLNIWHDTSLKSIAFLKKQGCQGVIASILSTSQANQLRQLKIPIIVYSSLQDMGEFPFIRTDSEQVAKIAFEYLWGKHFKNFAFFGPTEARWNTERLSHFSDCVIQSGHALHVYQGKAVNIPNNIASFAEFWTDMALNQGQEDLIKWIEDLPKPIAILASCDILGCHLSQVVTEIGLSIPDDIAILGIDNDEAFCQICTPPLSSIALNRNKAGYDAAELLDQIISGKERFSGQQIKIQPIEVKERASTDIFAVNDPDVVSALKFIRLHSHEPIQVEDVARHVALSKRLLQMKFQQNLNISVHHHIVSAHFNIAHQLLLETDLSIEEVALQSGFNYSSNMRRIFKERTGFLPNKFRNAYRVI